MALQDAACARTIAPRAASGAAMPFVACLGLIARLQLLLQLVDQVFLWTTCIALASNESSRQVEVERHVRRVSRSFVDQ